MRAPRCCFAVNPERLPLRPGSELLHPWALGALGLLVLNDHMLKGAGVLPGWLTGKLSDFAGVFLLPVLLFVSLDTLSCLTGRRITRLPLACSSALFTGVLFTLLKLDPGVNAWAARFIGQTRLDPSDLMALPMAPLAARWLVREPQLSWAPGRGFRTLAGVLAALACAATSAPMATRNYPNWKVESLGARQLGCARVEAWVSKSGKEGAGVSLRVRQAGPGPCRLEVAAAKLEIEGTEFAASALPAPLELDLSDRFTYVPFVFDNEALWNAGKRRGTLTLSLRFNGSTHETLKVSLNHEFGPPHVYRRDPNQPQPPSPGLVVADPSVPLRPPAPEAAE